MFTRWGPSRLAPAALVVLATVGGSGALAGTAGAVSTPTLKGIPEQGKTLTVSPANSDTVWKRCRSTCGTVGTKGATTYTLVSADVGATIKVVQNTVRSAPTPVVFPILLPPAITGSMIEGQTVSATPQWSVPPPTGAQLSYSWSRCTASGTSCVPTSNPGGPQYGLTSSDVGHVIAVAVSDTEPSGPPASQGPESTTGSSPVAAADAPGPTPSTAASTTSILASPSSATTNQLVTLIATITSADSGKPPTGTVAFADGGATIPGCGSVPANSFGQSVTVTCPAKFTAASSPEQLTAAFTPAKGSPVSSSSSPPMSLTIRKDSTTSSVDVSNPTVAVGGRATYNASIQGVLGGPVNPSGTVEFLDHGTPIVGCTTRPIATTSVGSSASCVVSYNRLGSHSITVAYSGDGNYFGSGSSSATSVTVRSVSLGAVSSTMQWSFRITPSYTRVLGLLIDSVSAGTSVVVKCQGGGCPFARLSTMVHQSTRCPTHGRAKCTTQRSKNIDLASGFHSRRLHNGALIRIYLTRPQWIGKYYAFTIRAAVPPRIRIACLAPGSTAPGVGC
jgi:Bacterial Ig-like domain (group 3)